MADSLHRCSILTLVYLSCASHHLIAKSCFAMQPFLSVYPVYDSPCMTWTVYWTLILHRLPTLILPALFTDYPECLPPAPIQSLSSDSDSALPTLRLKLVIKLCLSDLHTLLIKLHMDLNAPDSSLHMDRGEKKQSSVQQKINFKGGERFTEAILPPEDKCAQTMSYVPT